MRISELFKVPEPRSKAYNIVNETFGAVTHGIGFFLSVAGLVMLIIKTIPEHDTLKLVSFIIYGSSLILLYLFSTLYHSLVFTRARHVFQIFDHSSIFILIAGSYTPYTLVGVGGRFGWIMFVLIWVLAVLGILYKIFLVGKYGKFETILYIIMGWLVILASKPLVATLGPTGFMLLVSGGVAYTFGALLYSMRNVPFIHVIWHIFVMLGSILMYFSILFYL
ncbi:hemolysin III [Amylolactobacillus amylotrophicus DSM 20534]|uniref:Hemolysin III n=3 Tax=Amylolactobacillus TaxID=2767876 RepID=A0A0R1YKB8_9LACO|nr:MULTISPECIES: hemolysin III family protein [Amylolactobacillus]APT19177.1 hemolysin III [Amylolactobacillus amylophilus DSM 20533 = JCM 1125]KRK38550.1 hemolysin III [Amylolactobacillus amylotrophicus DSM 20534]KRM42807.1 hemolysin III [Amylolactobacillus amylophilus DSM 20533 = JCM 1125]GED79670.1 hemolysin III [Amylolactobacillus amylophilus]